MNKRLVCLNLRAEVGRDAMMKLLSGADIFITNYRVQALEPIRLTYEQPEETFPRPTRASILGCGSEGLESPRPGYDHTVFFARTGLMAGLTLAGGPPLIPVGGISNYSVAVALSRGIAAALYKRSATREGGKMDVSLLQAGTSINCMDTLNGFDGRRLPRDCYNCRHAGSNTYQGFDGEWSYLAIIDYRRFPEFCQMIGMPEIAANPRFSALDVYYENRGELTKILDKKFAEQPASYWHELLDAHDLPHEILHHLKDVPYDSQVQANYYTYFHECSDGAETVLFNSPVHLGSIDPSAIPYRASGPIDRDTGEVLKEVGYADEQTHTMYQFEEIK